MNPDKKILILYGSETGTAQGIAEDIWRWSKRFFFTGPVLPMDDYDVENLIHEHLVVFVCSTTGVGDEPQNMKKFWKFLLRKSLPQSSLINTNFGVLGLGDSSYTKFNFVAKRLDKRLKQLGAKPLINIGLCDYQHDLGHGAVYEPWIRNLWTKLNVDVSDMNKFVLVSRWLISHKIDCRSNTNLKIPSSDLYRVDTKNSTVKDITFKLVKNERTTPVDHFQDVRVFQFEVMDKEQLSYSPGDVFNIRPKNSNEQIIELFTLLRNVGIDLDTSDEILVDELYTDMPVPYFFRRPLRLYELAEQYWDLSAVPTKYAFSLLGHISTDKMEKEKCLEFCSPEGHEDYLNYCYRPKRNIIEVLQDFYRSAANLTITELFELFTPIKPRSFSIASSCKTLKSKALEILVAVVNYRTILKKERLGLCSNWLRDLPLGHTVYGWIKKGTFVFPDDSITPLIMIGPGTGVAPFHSLISERNFLNCAKNESLLLCFGCRNETKDFHYGDEFRSLSKSGKLTLICAFSRDQENKIYVQHKIAEHKAHLWHLLSQNALLYIAGNAKNMPANVKESIMEHVLQGVARMSADEAKAYMQQMESLGRLQLETW